MQVSATLLDKYNIPVPRYTSYPTVPYWNDTIVVEQWQNLFIKRFDECNQQEGISLYIHLPFCEKLCTFCGCNKKITTNHGVELEYITHLLQEWSNYRSKMNSKPIIKELHIGGGTPTFFSPENLNRIINTILADSIIPESHEFSFEGHPNNTTYEHLETLYQLGFNRVSFGVQDSNIEVQEVINRIQPHENVVRVVEWARTIGYESINLDLVYGLPLQNLSRMEKTIQNALSIKPDRIAFYSYAHVPWTSKAQRLFDESDLPDSATKMQLYQLGTKMFTENGYTDIGMDHFALPNDLMVKASKKGNLHRNFMGYTVQQTGMLLGLGVSSISDIYYGFAQNKKSIHEYYEEVSKGHLAVTKGYFLTTEDQAMRQYILDIACRGVTKFNPTDYTPLKKYSFPVLSDLEKDGFIIWDDKGLTVTTLGKHFIRNICRAFDIKLLSAETQKQTFSKAV
ncbi:MAG: oxygen-independent coproporphyrinogen III oxidase [Sphingobacteriia bacterium 28-36-52]|nr:MAG: oxygen-independent coproporphyrinogen III oxidase [Sphingobacteriia bacterium 28-36-52]